MNIKQEENAPQKITHGRCLCGAAQWTIHGEILDATICNCTACRRSGALWAYDYEGHGIHVTAPEGGLTAYVRGSGSPLSFNFCRVCGNLVFWRGAQAGRRWPHQNSGQFAPRRTRRCGQHPPPAF